MRIKNQKSKIKNQGGFTLVEMIVAIGIFAVVALVSVSTLLLLSDAQKKAFSSRNAYDSLRFSLEVMAKDIRTGVAFHCSDTPPLYEAMDCPTGGTSMTYTSALPSQVTYRLNGGGIEKSINGNLIGPITPPEVTITSLNFYVVGSPTSDQLHARVTITVVGRAGARKSASEFNLQTTITQRDIF